MDAPEPADDQRRERAATPYPAKTLGDMLVKRPADPAVVAVHRNRMLAEVRAYRLRQLREQLNLDPWNNPPDRLLDGHPGRG